MNNELPRRSFLQSSAALVSSAFLPSFPMKNNTPKAGEAIVGHGEFQYKVIPNWGLLDAGKNPVNDCHEMVEDAKGRLFLLTNETKK